MSNDRSRILCRKMFFSLEPIVLQLSQILDSYLEPTQHMRDAVHSSPHLEWMHMEGKPDRNCCSWCTILLEGVAQSSFAAAGDRVLRHLSSSFSAVCLRQATTKKFKCFCGGGRMIGERFRFPEKESRKHLRIRKIYGSGE